MASSHYVLVLVLVLQAVAFTLAFKSGHKVVSSAFSENTESVPTLNGAFRGRHLAEMANSTLTEEDKQIVLDVHNAARAKRNVNALVYDETLASYAQGWVNSLAVGACGPANADGEFGGNITAENVKTYGQNVFYGWYNNGTEPLPFNTSEAVGTWVAKEQYFKKFTQCKNRLRTCFWCKPGFDSLCDNYIYVVFGTTTKVGCGSFTCQVPDPASFYPVFLNIFACNYSPKPETYTIPF